MTFEDLALIYFHLQEHKSARHLVQDLKENMPKNILLRKAVSAAAAFVKQSTTEGLNNCKRSFKQAVGCLPKEHAELGDLVSIDGSLINAVLSALGKLQERK